MSLVPRSHPVPFRMATDKCTLQHLIQGRPQETPYLKKLTVAHKKQSHMSLLNFGQVI